MAQDQITCTRCKQGWFAVVENKTCWWCSGTYPKAIMCGKCGFVICPVCYKKSQNPATKPKIERVKDDESFI